MLLYVMLRHRSASQVSSLFFLTPSVTAILAYVFLGQSLGWLALAGLVISAAGVTLTTRGAGPRGRVMVRSPAGALKPLRLVHSRAGAAGQETAWPTRLPIP